MEPLGGLHPEHWDSMTPWSTACWSRYIDSQPKKDCSQHQLRSQAEPHWVLRGDTLNSYTTTCHAYLRQVTGPALRKDLEKRGISLSAEESDEGHGVLGVGPCAHLQKEGMPSVHYAHLERLAAQLAGVVLDC